MKAKKCMLGLYTGNGHVRVQQHFNSIASAVRFAHESGLLAYKVFVDGKVVRKGFC